MPTESKESTIESAAYQHLRTVWSILHSKNVKANHLGLPLEMVSKGLVRYFYGLNDSSSNPPLSPHVHILITQLNLLIKQKIFNEEVNTFLSNVVNDMTQGGKQIKAYIAHEFEGDVDDFLAGLAQSIVPITEPVQIPVNLKTGSTVQEARQQYSDRSIVRAVKAADKTEDYLRRYAIFTQELQIANVQGELDPDDLTCFQLNLANCALNNNDMALCIKHLRETLQTLRSVRNLNFYLKQNEEKCKKLLSHVIVRKTIEMRNKTSDHQRAYEIFENGLKQTTRIGALWDDDLACMQFNLSVEALACKDKPKHVQHLREVLHATGNAKERNNYLLGLEERAKKYLLDALKKAAFAMSKKDERKVKLYLLALHLARENNRAPLDIPILLRALAFFEWDNNRGEKYIKLMQLAIQFCDENHDKPCDLLPIRDEIASDFVVGLIKIAVNKLSENKIDQSNKLYQQALVLLKTFKKINSSDLPKLIEYLFKLTENTVDPAEKQNRYEKALAIAKEQGVARRDVALFQKLLANQAWHAMECDKSIELLLSAIETLSTPDVEKENIALLKEIKRDLLKKLINWVSRINDPDQINTRCTQALSILNTIDDVSDNERVHLEETVQSSISRLLIDANNELLTRNTDEAEKIYQMAMNLLKEIKSVIRPANLIDIIQLLFNVTRNTVDPVAKQARYEQVLMIAKERGVYVGHVAEGQQMLGMQAWKEGNPDRAMGLLQSALNGLTAVADDSTINWVKDIKSILINWLIELAESTADLNRKKELVAKAYSILNSEDFAQKKDEMKSRLAKLSAEIANKEYALESKGCNAGLFFMTQSQPDQQCANPSQENSIAIYRNNIRKNIGFSKLFFVSPQKNNQFENLLYGMLVARYESK